MTIFVRSEPNFLKTRQPFMKSGMKKSIGYARFSHYMDAKNTEVDALQKQGCHKVFIDEISEESEPIGTNELQAAISAVDFGDELVIQKLDQLGRVQVEVFRSLPKKGNKSTYYSCLRINYLDHRSSNIVNNE